MKSKLRAGAAWSIPGGYQDGGASMLQSIWKFQWGKMMETNKHSNDLPSSCVALCAESGMEGASCVPGSWSPSQ